MPDPKNTQKGVILLIVLATILVVVILSGAVLGIISNQSGLTQHKINRTKALYEAKGIMNYAQVMLRKGLPGGWAADATTYKYACFRNLGCIDNVNNDFPIDDDSDLPYKIQVTIYPKNTTNPGGPSGVTQINIKTSYTSQ